MNELERKIAVSTRYLLLDKKTASTVFTVRNMLFYSLRSDGQLDKLAMQLEEAIGYQSIVQQYKTDQKCNVIYIYIHKRK